MPQAATISRPELTFPPAEAAFLSAAYDVAGTILEYGCGGSTVMASELPETTVWSVESDKDFMAGVRAYLDSADTKAKVHLHHADVGPTGKWGAPKDAKAWRRWHHYPLDVWDLDGFSQPDVVLIDGRFRAGCFLATAFRTQAPVDVYWDDYIDREKYHEVERFGPPVEVVGRMARFKVAPMTPKGADLAWIMDVFGRKQ